MKTKELKNDSSSKNMKLKLLENESRFADLELNLGKLENKFKEVWASIPDIKERSERIEDLLNIINLGLIDYKDKANKLKTRVSELETLSTKTDEHFKTHSERIRELNKNLNEFSTKIQTLSSVKDDIFKNIKQEILPDMNSLKDSIGKNRMNLEQIRSEIGEFRSNLKALQETVQLVDMNSVIQQFDNFNIRIANVQAEIDTFRNQLPSKELYDKDLDIMKSKIQDFSSNVIELNTKLKEIETNLESLNNKITKSNITEKLNELKVDIKNKEKLIFKNESKIGELNKNLEKRDEVLGNKLVNLEKIMKKSKNIGFLESIRKEVEDHAKNLEETKNTVEKLADKTGKMYYEVDKKVSKFSDIEREIKNLKLNISELKEIANSNVNFKRNLESAFVKNVKKEFEIVHKELDGIKKIKENEKIPKDIPKDIINEIRSLKEITSRLTTENEKLRENIGKTKSVQVTGGIPPHVVAEMADRIKTMERRIQLLESEIRRELVVKPVILE